MDTFRVRLNCVDHYQASPTDLDPDLFGSHGSTQRLNAPSLPVIRVFGSTETGQKVCAHVHGALPYLYIEYRGSMDKGAVNIYIQQLRASIDHALAVSYRRNTHDGKVVYVAHITLVKGVPFFGYHVGYRCFLKIYLLNPLNMTRFADLLHQGAIMGQRLQPFEAHLQYLAQWMCDYNLYGCAYIECKVVKFRSPIPEYLEMESTKHKWHDCSVSEDLISDSTKYPRRSHCAIEVDICVQDILNRDEVLQRDWHSDFVECFQNLQPDEKLVHSLAGLWKDETRRRKLRMGLTDSSSSPFPPEVLISMSADSRSKAEPGWIHEEEFREQIKYLVEKERLESSRSPSFDDFISQDKLQGSIQTTLESVEDLFPGKLRASLGISTADSPQDSASGDPNRPEVVEESKIPKSNDDDFLYDTELAMLNDVIDNPSENKNSTTSSIHLRSDIFQSRKRQKLTHMGSAANVKHHKDVVAYDDLERRSRSQSPRVRPSIESSPPPGSQLSQGSIKSQGNGSNRNRSFKVVKDPYRLNKAKRRLSVEDFPKTPSQIYFSSQSSSNQTAPKSRATELQTSQVSQSPAGSATSPPRQLLRMAKTFNYGFEMSKMRNIQTFAVLPPNPDQVTTTMGETGLPDQIYRDAYYGDERDVPERSRDYAGREFKLESSTVPYLPAFDPTGTSLACHGAKPPLVVDAVKQERSFQRMQYACNLRNWEIGKLPPSHMEIETWANEEEQRQADIGLSKNKPKTNGDLSQIDGPTQKNPHGFKFSQKQQSTSVQHETQYMSIMSVEVHVNTRDHLVADPEYDEVACIFWCVDSDDDEASGNGTRVGVVVLSDQKGIGRRISKETGSLEVDEEDTELDVINRIVDIIRGFDPDILTGFEVHNGSWGYLIERARIKFEYDLCDELSRMTSQSHGRFGKDADRWGFNHTSTIRVTGRHMINIWRAMRSELNLLQYTMENVAFHLLHKRIPHYSFKSLTQWYKSSTPRDLAKCIDYYLSRVQMNLEILDANELIPRTSEQARLIGVDFFSVFSRGSQFKVESFMFRIAKPENFVLVSPSRKQVGQQNALECLPLVMEPQSNFYNSPLLVLDFQSLYPSIMIAYNYCYSTCLGRIVGWRGQNKMGFADFKRQPQLLELVKNYINVSPNGMMYVKPEMRKSLLAKMLSEILETRVMVKSGMKADKEDKTLQQLLNNRQLALKLLANVTYGYTSASFSGRMPCAEIADSIVQTARETLEKTVAFIHSVPSWGAEVVYGDTDSLFVYLKGRTREQAFVLGNEIANAVTNMNPKPIKLKFEKVYHPCVLLAKKRYVGFKYESPSQTEPEFDAKGIETVRRDGTPAEQMIEEKALKILFRSADLSQVKAYFQQQCTKIMSGRVSIQDFCFAKEVKLGSYANKGPPPPGALISTRRMLADPRTEPQYGERVPYVVTTGAPGARLIDRCVAPETLLKDDSAELDAEYYITKNLIPPLERIFNLVGANVHQWYDEMPKVQRVRDLQALPTRMADGKAFTGNRTLESYMKSSHCLVCRMKLPRSTLKMKDGMSRQLCQACSDDQSGSLYTLQNRLLAAQKKVKDIEQICRSCSGLCWSEEIKCDSKDCPVFYSRIKAKADEGRGRVMVEKVVELLEEDRMKEGLDW